MEWEFSTVLIQKLNALFTCESYGQRLDPFVWSAIQLHNSIRVGPYLTMGNKTPASDAH